MTDKPFGMNLAFLPSVTPPDYPGFIRAIVESGVKIGIETAGNNPKKWMPQLKEAGITVIPQVHCDPTRLECAGRRGGRVVSVERLRMRRTPGRGRHPEHGPTASCGQGAEDSLHRLGWLRHHVLS